MMFLMLLKYLLQYLIRQNCLTISFESLLISLLRFLFVFLRFLFIWFDLIFFKRVKIIWGFFSGSCSYFGLNDCLLTHYQSQKRSLVVCLAHISFYCNAAFKLRLWPPILIFQMCILLLILCLLRCFFTLRNDVAIATHFVCIKPESAEVFGNGILMLWSLSSFLGPTEKGQHENHIGDEL